MMPTTMLIIAGVLALVATVLAFIYVVPEKKREKLGAFGKFLHDTCNFKYAEDYNGGGGKDPSGPVHLHHRRRYHLRRAHALPHRVQLLDR